MKGIWLKLEEGAWSLCPPPPSTGSAPGFISTLTNVFIFQMCSIEVFSFVKASNIALGNLKLVIICTYGEEKNTLYCWNTVIIPYDQKQSNYQGSTVPPTYM